MTGPIHQRVPLRTRGGSFALAGPRAAVPRVLSAAGLLGWFEVHGTVDEAVAGRRGSVGPALAGEG